MKNSKNSNEIPLLNALIKIKIIRKMMQCCSQISRNNFPTSIMEC